LTARELARALKVTADTVWRYTRTARIPSIRLGPRDYRYRLTEVLEALAKGDATCRDPGTPRLRPTDPARLRSFCGLEKEGGAE
ncbi:MAG: helix-turn-helix domain-containing protein, partial [Bacteroidota bacterium]